MITKGSKYQLLNNKEWLEEKYLIQKLSPFKISNEVGCANSNSVRQALERFDINIRSEVEQSDLDHGPIEVDYDVLIGSLLGDGGLNITGYSTNTAFFYKKNKYLDHIEYVAKKFYSHSYKSHIKTDCSTYTYRNKSSIKCYYRFSTYTYSIFGDLYRQWYPNNKKIVPRNIKITAGILLNWFLDDGSTSLRSDRKSRQIVTTFSSQSFTREDNQFLCDLINTEFDLGARVSYTNSGTKCLVKIPQSKVDQFYKIVGPCPVPSLAYKWK